MADSAVVYVIRRGWHIDIGVGAPNLGSDLGFLTSTFPAGRYVAFGFGDRRYLLARKHNAPLLIEALWPGRALLLLTGLSAPPTEAFGAASVIELKVTPSQLRGIQSFLWSSMAGAPSSDEHSPPRPVDSGPYPGSLYFAAGGRYSALHTCNTWAAEALQAGGLPVHSAGVAFAWQLWAQVQRLRRRQTAES